VGSLLALSLAQHGLTVDWLVRNPARRAELSGLTLQWDEQQLAPRTELLRVHAAGSSIAPPDWLLIAVKAQHIPAALAACPQLAHTRQLVVANGLLTGGYHLGLLYGGAVLDGATVRAVPESRLLIGQLPQGAGAAAEIAPLLAAPWLATAIEPEIEIRQWHKLALNCVVNPLTALLDCANGELENVVSSPLIAALLAEFSAVAHARLDQRWTYSAAELHTALQELLSATRANSSSMRQDVLAGRETEIGHLNLAVAALGAELGLECPFNALLGRMVFLMSTNRGGL
jgi:2-dehydropantoate 2-reductase